MLKISQDVLSRKYIVILSTMAVIIFTIFRWYSNGKDLTAFVCLTESRTIESIFNRDFHFQQYGYDGIYFYCYAHDPLATAQLAFDERKNETVPHIQGVIQAKNSSFRKKRIGYSAAAWLFSGFGVPKHIPLSLVLVNIIAFIMLIIGITHLFQLKNLPSSWSLFTLTFVGVYSCIARDLADLLALSFALWVLVFLEKRWILLATFTALLALFTKENLGFFVVIPMLMYWMKNFKRGISSSLLHAILFSIPFICYFLWFVFLNEESAHARGLSSTWNNFTWPFYGMFSSIKGDSSAFALSGILTLSIYSLVVEAGVDLFRKLKTLKTQFDYILAGILISYMVVSICFSYKIYEDYWSLGRNLLPLQLSAVVWLIWSKRKISLFNSMLSIFTALLFVAIMILYP